MDSDINLFYITLKAPKMTMSMYIRK